MRKPLWFFNVLLALLALALLWVLLESFRNGRPLLAAQRRAPSVPSAISRSAAGEETPTISQASVPPLAGFAIIGEKEAFRSPVPDPPLAAPTVQKAPPPPLPVLLGTIFLDDERQAVLRVQNRVATYRQGDGVAGGVLEAVETDRIVIRRGDTTSEVPLRSAIRSGLAPASPPSAPAVAPPPEPAGPVEQKVNPGETDAIIRQLEEAALQAAEQAAQPGPPSGRRRRGR